MKIRKKNTYRRCVLRCCPRSRCPVCSHPVSGLDSTGSGNGSRVRPASWPSSVGRYAAEWRTCLSASGNTTNRRCSCAAAAATAWAKKRRKNSSMSNNIWKKARFSFNWLNLTQSINQSISQSINQPVNQSIKESINQSINQSVDQSINKSINQSIDQSMDQ